MKDRRKVKRTLWAVHHMTETQGFPPSIREIAGYMGMSQTGTNTRLSYLVEEGYLNKKDGKARTITLTEKGKSLIDV